uniref:Elongation factor 1a n=1 Tax=Chrysanthemum morifolium TaxID=41568 RepID=A0A6G6XDN3_CHRMO|nr:elongation factor 1a [Chrysanthemum x morifolium]
MPRKISYGVDYDDGYDYDDDYPDDSYDNSYDIGIDEPESGWDSPEIKPEVKKEIIRQNVWRCPICTYDNEDYMSSCDICGVLRNPLIRSSNNGQSSTVGGICMNSGASVMAKSLFSSSPCRLKDASSTKEDIFSHLHGNMRGQFHELHKAIVSEKHYKINIAPFKFDIPSPDDLVTMGLRSYRIGSKVAPDLNKPSTSNASSNKAINNGNSKSIAKPSAVLSSAKPSSVSAPLNSKDKFQHVEENNHASVSETQTHSLSSEMTSLTMSVKSDDSKIPDKAKVPRSQFKPENWMLPDQTKDSLTQLNLAIVGHVDSGKSTLSGRLLHLLGQISQKQMHKYEKDAKSQGKGSFAYAWAMDESAEERERGVTMTVAVAYFSSNKYHVVVLDSPGHRDFVPNLISGATQADAAILVIDASIGAFEAGIEIGGGQTREHAQLIRSFGADQLIVCVNKMDAVQYSKERFDAIKLQLGTFLRSCNYRDSSVSWVPLSAMENQNLVGRASDSRLLSWYKGPSLLEAIDALQPPAREYSKPLLMPICDVLKLTSQGQVSVCGKLDAGALRNGSKVLVLPSGDIATVRSLERDSKPCTIARAGDSVAVSLQGIDATSVMSGGVLCHPDFPVAVSNHLELKILVLDVQTPILIGSQLEFHIHHAKEAARVTKMVSLLDSKTGKVTKKSPRFLLAKQSAIVEVVLQEDVCVDEFSSSRALGRVFLRSSGTTVAVGVVTRVIPSEQN